MNVLMTRTLNLIAGLGLYDLWANRNLEEIHDTLIKLASLDGNEQVLDVGCGTGILTSRLAETLRERTVYGIDMGPQMIRISKKRAREKNQEIGYEVGGALNLPHANGKFDVVFTCLLLHLLEASEKELALREIYRVLRPEGTYISAEFKEYTTGFLRRTVSTYPAGIIGKCGFCVHSKASGPSITKRHRTSYRVLVKPEIRGKGTNG